jgi:hypothetical protein
LKKSRFWKSRSTKEFVHIKCKFLLCEIDFFYELNLHGKTQNQAHFSKFSIQNVRFVWKK